MREAHFGGAAYGDLPRHRALNRLLTSPVIRRIAEPLIKSPLRPLLASAYQKTMKKPPKLSAERRELLRDHFREDILRVQALVERDLSLWLEPMEANDGPGQARAGNPAG